MANRRARQDKALEEIYALVPDMEDCKGLCQDSCGPIPITKREWQRLDMEGVQIPNVAIAMKKVLETNGEWSCPALGEDGLCTVYDKRPLICRLYGTVEDLRCAHGCRPKGRLFTRAEAFDIIERATEASGGLADGKP